MSTAIKFCGLRRSEDIEFVASLGAEYAGFIMSPKFWRYVAPEDVATLRQGLPKTTKVIGVFVDEDVSYVAECINDGVIDIAQLHGNESEDYIKELREMTSGKAVITKVFLIKSEEDIEAARKSSADYVLLDSGVGGTGQTFDWTLIRDIGREYFLAGGLNPDNVADAVTKFHPMAVDVSSGVETDKLKDFAKMQKFAQAVRGGKYDTV